MNGGSDTQTPRLRPFTDKGNLDLTYREGWSPRMKSLGPNRRRTPRTDPEKTSEEES